MSLARRFRRREYLHGSLWFVPLIAALVGPPLAWAIVALEGRVTVPAGTYGVTAPPAEAG